MTKMQKIILDYVAIFVALLSYIVLKTYTDFHYLQIVQKFFISFIFISGLVIVINNLVNLKQARKKYIGILLLCFGALLVVYSGFVLYLILAFQNASF